MDDPSSTLTNVTEAGSRPTKRIKDAKTARALFTRCLDNASGRLFNNCKIRQLVDGNAPYKNSELARLGQSWRANVNWREAKGILRTKSTAYYELLLNVPTFITVQIKNASRKNMADAVMVGEWEEAIAEEYTDVMQQWSGFWIENMILARSVLAYGPGIVWWPDADDWHYKVAPFDSCLFPTDAGIMAEDLEFIMIRDTIKVHELWEKVDDPDDELKPAEWQEKMRTVGWNPNIVLECIKKMKDGQTSTDAYQVGEWSTYQQMIKNNDYGADESDFKPLKVVHILTREPNGKVSHLIIPEEWEMTDYLYERPDEYDAMESAVVVFAYDIEDGLLNSVRGIGHEIRPHIELSNRVLNSAVDGSIISAGLLAKNRAGGNDEISIMRQGFVTVVNENLELMPQNVGPAIGRLVEIRSLMFGILANNMGVYRPRQEDPNAVQKTARQVVSEESREARFEAGQTHVFYVQWDLLHREALRRLAKSDYPESAKGYAQHKEFVDNCKARGVPPEYLNTKKLIAKASRSIGGGSPMVRDRVTQELVKLSSAYDERGKMIAIRDRTAALVGYDKVDRYLPMQNRDKIPSAESSWASLENNDIMEGAMVVVGSDQQHLIHIRIHLPMISTIAGEFQQNPQAVDIMKSMGAMKAGTRHVAEHVQFLSNDLRYRGVVDELGKLIKGFLQVLAVMEKVAQQQAQAAQAQQQQGQQAIAQAQQQLQDRGTILELEKIRGRLQLEGAKQQSIMQIRAAKADQGMRIADAISAEKIRRMRAEEAAQSTQEGLAE
jgi:hypothetical protein